MAHQEQRAARQRKANEQFEAIYAAAVARVKENAALRADAPDEEAWGEQRPEGLSDDDWHLACSVRHLRDGGMAWWQIGRDLGLPGAGDSATTGKGGAGQARKFYSLGFGAVPRTQKERTTPTAPRSPEGAARAAVKAVPKMERKAAVKAGVGVIGDDMEDADIVAMVAGRSIAWTINLNDIDGRGDEFKEEAADVHRKMVRVEVCGGERCVSFKEVDRGGPIALRETAGATRIVRVRSIHTIR